MVFHPFVEFFDAVQQFPADDEAGGAYVLPPPVAQGGDVDVGDGAGPVDVHHFGDGWVLDKFHGGSSGLNFDNLPFGCWR